MTAVRVLGRPTRGTTAPRRLRRVDRWLLAAHRPLLMQPDLVVVDLGFGARPTTTIELAHRLRQLNPRSTVIGVEADPARVAAARPHAGTGVDFVHGGFDLAGIRPDVVRALNVLRQYDEDEVVSAWATMRLVLQPCGLIVEGTCDESGVLGAWVSLRSNGAEALTLAMDPRRMPSAVAARLPKALIHRNIPGEAVHRLLADLDEEWTRHAPLSAYGNRQRWAATIYSAQQRGWPVLDGPTRWRRGEVTLAWPAFPASGR